ncbi:MAG TPA: 2-C-methyl-D-erythritol 2,4-cyclodiphosphate synthase [Actinobacteria bacterium]|nr:2-C-methyl-D-erythritol 2,4-cyclodiphosphate synthase [Actinomycetota bacterium]
MRVGWGVDAHQFGGPPPILLGGVEVDASRGLVGTSDADVLSHALADALLGAAALGDLGEHFPGSDPKWQGADSLDLLRHTVGLVGEAGYAIVSVDTTVISQSVRISGHKGAIRATLAIVLGVELGQVSVKATTTDEMGFLGRDEGIAALAVATLENLEV